MSKVCKPVDIMTPAERHTWGWNYIQRMPKLDALYPIRTPRKNWNLLTNDASDQRPGRLDLRLSPLRVLVRRVVPHVPPLAVSPMLCSLTSPRLARTEPSTGEITGSNMPPMNCRPDGSALLFGLDSRVVVVGWHQLPGRWVLNVAGSHFGASIAA